jgi:hypothetical protein
MNEDICDFRFAICDLGQEPFRFTEGNEANEGRDTNLPRPISRTAPAYRLEIQSRHLYPSEHFVDFVSFCSISEERHLNESAQMPVRKSQIANLKFHA